MRQRGRVSSNVIPLAVADERPELKPLQALKCDEKLVFDVLARENLHLTQLDVPLMMVFARASAGAFKAGNASDFGKIAKTALNIARALRLCPVNRTHPEKLGRRYGNPPGSHHQLWKRQAT